MQALSNIQNLLYKYHQLRVYSNSKECKIYYKVTKNRVQRRKPALQHISEIGLKYKKSMFEKLIYKFRLYYLPGTEKPELNNSCMKIQQELAILLLGIDLKNIVFIDKANARSEYSKEYLWHTPEEYYHPDIKQPTTKQVYQKAEFVSTIK